MIRKHCKQVGHAFHIMKEEEKELQIMDRLSNDNVFLLQKQMGNAASFIWQAHMAP